MGFADLLSQWISGYPAGGERVLSMIGIEIHWLILQYVLSLPLLAVISEGLWLKTGNDRWKKLSRTLAKGFVMVFAVGAAMGTAAEFGLVLLWPNLTEAAGRYIYFPFYMEIFAFITEAVFVYMYFYAENKLPPKAHLLVGVLATFGAWWSAAMILSVNAFMQSPVNVLAQYNPITGKWAPPEVILYVPIQIAQALDVNKLAAVGAKVLAASSSQVEVSLPSGIVRQLMYEAFTGKTIGQSTLAAVMKPEALKALSSAPLKAVLDKIVANIIMNVGPYTVTFLSGGYLETLLHSLGSAVVVGSFTVAGAYSLRLLTSGREDEDREYFRRSLKFAAIVGFIALAVQGTLSGHAMGAAVADHNPEKLAAMEGTSSSITSLPKMIGMGWFTGKLMPLLAYGSSQAKLPSYDQIAQSYRPPLIVHYMYYTKLGLALLLGLISLVLLIYVLKRDEPSRWVLALTVISPVLAQVVSFLGWAVREVGRKPWAIYGIMDVKTELTMNPPPSWEIAVIALYFTAVLLALGFFVYRYLWRR